MTTATGANGSWNTNASGGEVRALAIAGDTLFVGGTFTSLGGNALSALGAANKTTAVAVTTWPPAIAGTPTVNALAIGTGNALYVGGEFTTVGLQPTPNDPTNSYQGIVEFSSATPAAPISGTPNTSGALNPGVNAVLWTNSTLYLGGSMVSAGGNRCVGLCISALNAPN